MPHNSLGDIRAENDHLMLDKAFYEIPEYRTLIEKEGRYVVVGRRGTGKSAIYYKLQQYFRVIPKTCIIELVPNEAEVIGLRYFEKLFESNPAYLRAACSLAWEYAVLIEILICLLNNYKVRSQPECEKFVSICSHWKKQGDSVTSRLFAFLDERIDKTNSVEKRIAILSQDLGLKNLQEAVKKACEESNYSIRIIADRLDDGYQPDVMGIAILTGIINSLSKITASISNTTSIVFLRDNVFRAIQQNDPDYSRNIEGDVLRLHWDEYHLFNMICNRIRTAFDISDEKSLKVWDRVTARNIKGMDGFRRCLRLTLYRPRDLLVLLNNAFNNAISHARGEIVDDDIDISAKEISSSRLDDLKKEYREILPGLDSWVNAFVGTEARMPINIAESKLAPLFTSNSISPANKQMLAILRTPQEIIRCLYSVGFIGILKPSVSSFVFCHDGRQPDLSFEKSQVLIHPCYWIALNIKEESLPADDAENIHDEYDIEVCSETPEIRKQKLGQFISSLDSIGEGEDGAAIFEEWCLGAVKILFANGLVNAELHPNKNKTQRRDVVARNNENTETWKRILKDYGTRQVIFEVKNYSKELGSDEYRQMLSYLTNEHGRLGFIVNRASDETLHKGKELQWVQEIYHEHKKLIIKLPAKVFIRWLSKLRNPEKYDIPDQGLEKLLDTYERMYVRLGGATSIKK